MSVRPIDIKTNIMGNNDASRLREEQKAQEAGLAEHVAQNKNASAQKTETVQRTDATDKKIVRKEDEESEKKQHGSSTESNSSHPEKPKEEDDDEKKHPTLSDGTRGLKIDLKA